MTDLISPVPILHFVDNNGNTLVGGKLFTYAAGTTTKLATYTDSTGGTPNVNPVILNSRGEANVWLPSGVAYKFTLAPSTDTDPPTNAFWTVDQILSSSVTLPISIAQGGTGATTAQGALQMLGSPFNKFITSGTTTLSNSVVGEVIAPSTTGVTLTMPPAASLVLGNTFTFLQINAASDILTITQNAAETFNGPLAWAASSLTLSAQGSFVTIQFNGTNYYVIGGSVDQTGQAVPPGAVSPYVGTAAPTGWLLCFGQAVSKTTYAALFAVIGTTFGSSGGNFNVPDLRGRIIAGTDAMGGTPANRLGSGNTGGITGGATMAASGGEQSHTLTVAEEAALASNFGSVNGTGALPFIASFSAGSPVAVSTTGGGGAHNNTQPTLVMNYIIKT